MALREYESDEIKKRPIPSGRRGTNGGGAMLLSDSSAGVPHTGRTRDHPLATGTAPYPRAGRCAASQARSAVSVIRTLRPTCTTGS